MVRRSGVLLVNLGTPASPAVGDVRRYLREFLSDPYVLDIPAVARKLLLECVILPTRPKKSAAAYASIWTEAGSPLRFHGEALRDLVRTELAAAELRSADGATVEVVGVELGMRYGAPSIRAGLEALVAAGADAVVVLPLFPQHSKSAWTSAVAKVHTELGAMRAMLPTSVVPPFYDAPAFLDAAAEVAAPVLAEFGPDRVMMSFHGLPERHIREADLFEPRGHCLASADCCEAIGEHNRFCYRAQSFATARGLAARLGLEAVQSAGAGEAPGGGGGAAAYEVAFQSRLGRTPWIRPFTDERLTQLPAEGVKRLAVLCPSFVADCLETLEEIGIRAEADFRAHGGEALCLVPCVNAAPAWGRGVADLVRAALVGAGANSAQSRDLPRCGESASPL